MKRHRSAIAGLVAATGLLLGGFTSQAYEPVYTEAELAQITPTSPNPHLALLPSTVVPDYDYWDSMLYWGARNLPDDLYKPRADVVVEELEGSRDPVTYALEIDLATGKPYTNSDFPDAQELPPEFGSDPVDQIQEIQISASFRPGTFITTFVHEDNGAINVNDNRPGAARPVNTGLLPGQITAALSTIGDGPHGSTGTGQGDFDYYATGHLPSGVTIEIDVDTFTGGQELDSYLILWRSNGSIVDFNDNDPRFLGTRDSYIRYFIPEGGAGTYYVSVSSWQPRIFETASLPEFATRSGSGGGYYTEGDYSINISVSDLDFFLINELRAGDVLSFGNVEPGAPVLDASLYNPSQTLRLFSNQNATFLYPDGHPYKNNAPIHGALVVPSDGDYYLALSGSSSGDYIVDLEVHRPWIETESTEDIPASDPPPDPGGGVGEGDGGGGGDDDGGDGGGGGGPSVRDHPTRQVLYLTMWGERISEVYGEDPVVEIGPWAFSNIEVNLSVFNDGFYNAPDQTTEITPLIYWMEQIFTLGDDEELETRDAVMRGLVGEDIRNMVDLKLGDSTDVRVGPPPDNFSDYSEIWIGGSVAETGIDTIGIAQTIDVGNFDFSEKAIVLMDFITEDVPLIPHFVDPSSDPDIQQASDDAAYYRKWLEVVTTVVAHEAGHFFGNFHVDTFSGPNNVMNQFYVSAPVAGAGPDGVTNTFDDIQTSLGPDVYSPVEGFKGVEDTRETTYYGVGGGNPTSLNTGSLHVDFRPDQDGIGTEPDPFNVLQSAIGIIDAGGTVNFTSSSGPEVFTGDNVIDFPMTLKNYAPEMGVVRIGEEEKDFPIKLIR